MSLSHEVRWLIGSADDLAGAQSWLRQNLTDGAWQLDLLGLEEHKGPSGARIAVSCRFATEESAASFASGYLSGRAAHVPLAAAPPPETDADKEFNSGGRRILEGPKPVSAGKLHFLELAKVREHFGDQWPKLASRAEALVRRAIERRLTPQDVYRKTADLNFVLMFANLNAHEAELKCTVIAEEITRMLVGDELGAGMLAVKTVATEVDGPAMLRKTGDADLAQAIEAEVEVERLRREAPPGAGNLAPIVSTDPWANLRFMYRPIWDVRRSAVANFILLPGRAVPGGQWRAWEQPTGDAEFQRLFDEKVLDRVVSDLHTLHRQGRRLAISFPLHFETVSTPSKRSSLLTTWRALPQECRRLGVFEIVGVPEGIPQGRVAEIASHLRAEARGVLLRLPLSTTAFRSFSDTGIMAVGADVAGKGNSEEQLMSEFKDFVNHAEKARLIAYVHGLRSFSLTIGAIGAGFSYVDGDPVSSISDHLEDAYRFGLEDLYAQRLRGVGTEH